MNLNNEVLVKARISIHISRQPKPKRVNYGKIRRKLRELFEERQQLMWDMEQEAEVERGPIADEYGTRLEKLNNKIEKLKNKLG